MKSVFDQTFTDWEIIIIDNNSVDSTEELVASIKDDRISYYKIDNEGIVAKSRNLGIKYSKGQWIAFLDSDDWWREDKLKNCVAAIKKNGVDLIYHKVKFLTNKPFYFKNKALKSWKLNKPVFKNLIINGNPIVNSSVIVRKSLLSSIQGIDESPEMVGAEDFNTWLRISKLTDNFLYMQTPYGYYRAHSSNLSNKNMSYQAVRAAKEFMNLLTQDEIIKSEANFTYRNGRFHYLNKNYKIAKKIFKSVFKVVNYRKKLEIVYMLEVIYFKEFFNLMKHKNE